MNSCPGYRDPTLHCAKLELHRRLLITVFLVSEASGECAGGHLPAHLVDLGVGR